MSESSGRLRPPPVERFAGTEHVFDLAMIAAQLRAEAHTATDGHRQMTILRQEPVTLVLFDFETGGTLVDHVADGLVTIHALTGRVEVKTPEGRHELAAGSLLVLSPGVRHDVFAPEASQLLLTVHLKAKG